MKGYVYPESACCKEKSLWHCLSFCCDVAALKIKSLKICALCHQENYKIKIASHETMNRQCPFSIYWKHCFRWTAIDWICTGYCGRNRSGNALKVLKWLGEEESKKWDGGRDIGSIRRYTTCVLDALHVGQCGLGVVIRIVVFHASHGLNVGGEKCSHQTEHKQRIVFSSPLKSSLI